LHSLNNTSDGCSQSNSIEKRQQSQQCFSFQIVFHAFDRRFMLHTYFTSFLLLILSCASFYIPIIYHAQRMLCCQVPILVLLALQLLPGRQYWTSATSPKTSSILLHVLTASHIWHLSCFLFMVLVQFMYFISFRCITYIHQAVREIDTAYSQYVFEAQTPHSPAGRGPIDTRSAVAAEAAAYNRLRKRIKRLVSSKTHESVDVLLPRIHSPTKQSSPVFYRPSAASTSNRAHHPPQSSSPSPSGQTDPILNPHSPNSPETQNGTPQAPNQDQPPPSTGTAGPSNLPRPMQITPSNTSSSTVNQPIGSSSTATGYNRPTTRSKVDSQQKSSQSQPNAFRVSSADLRMSSFDQSGNQDSSISLPLGSLLSSIEAGRASEYFHRHAKLISRFIPRTKLSLIFLVSYVPSDVTARRALPIAFLSFLYFYAILYFF
jgi:hypothetical protein